MKKVVLKLEVHDDKAKQKAMKTVSSLSGVESIAMDMKDKKLTVTGGVDPVDIVKKLRKLCYYADILSVGPAKEPEKKKDDGKKDDAKKDEKKDDKKPDDKKADNKDVVAELVKAYRAYNPQMTMYYHVRSVEEDPNACVIC